MDSVESVDSEEKDEWQIIKSKEALTYDQKTGMNELSVLVENVGDTTNKWKLMCGIAPKECVGNEDEKEWLVAQKSYAYIGGTGGKCYDEEESTLYGSKWGMKAGDIITCKSNIKTGQIEFLLNVISQGVAFDNFTPNGAKIFAAVWVIAKGSRLRLMQKVRTERENGGKYAYEIDPKDDQMDVLRKLHMDLAEAYELQQGDKIDHRDYEGRFIPATIVEKKGTNLKIHYDEWFTKCVIWSDFTKELQRFAKAGSISKRPAHRFKDLKEGDYIDINPTQRHFGWKHGQIRRFDKESGQIQVSYEFGDKTYLYWSHFDNEQEVSGFASMTHAVKAAQDDKP